MVNEHRNLRKPERTDGARTSNGRQAMEDRLHQIASEGSPAIERRLHELDREWSAGRAAKVVTAAGILSGLVAARYAGRWALAVPAACGVILLQHLTSRESWLTAALKQLGLRSGCEIERERCALKALRGDFTHLPVVYDRVDADALARLEGEGGISADPPPIAEANRAAIQEVLERVEASQ
jgi:hypothetical protein